MDEVIAKLDTIQRLLTIAVSDPKFSALLEREKGEVHRAFGVELNSLFPSDPQYNQLHALLNNFNDAADTALMNIQFPPASD